MKQEKRPKPDFSDHSDRNAELAVYQARHFLDNALAGG